MTNNQNVEHQLQIENSKYHTKEPTAYNNFYFFDNYKPAPIDDIFVLSMTGINEEYWILL